MPNQNLGIISGCPVDTGNLRRTSEAPQAGRDVWAGRTITLRVRGFPDEFRFRNRAGMRGGTVEGMQVDGMVKRYSHIQLEVKRAAIQALSSCPKITTSEGVNVTKHVTKQAEKKLADGSG